MPSADRCAYLEQKNHLGSYRTRQKVGRWTRKRDFAHQIGLFRKPNGHVTRGCITYKLFFLKPITCLSIALYFPVAARGDDESEEEEEECRRPARYCATGGGGGERVLVEEACTAASEGQGQGQGSL